jgi:hypothetical protein
MSGPQDSPGDGAPAARGSRPGARHEVTSAPTPELATPGAWLTQMLAEHRLSTVRPNMARSGDLINQARTHVASARTIASSDSTLALAACHDAIRKSLDAHAGAAGYRFENSPGAHRTAIEYGRQVLAHLIDPGDLDEANRLRNR